MKLDITKPELVWPGKYDEDGNLAENRGAALPFQVIETIKEGRATRQSGQLADLFSYAAQKDDEDNWHNKLIWGDNLLVMASLLKNFAGKVDLIYIDPPFATGSDFSFKAPLGDSGDEIVKEQSMIEEKAYRDTWGQGISSWLTMMYPRIILMKELLSDEGSLYLHVDYRVAFHMRLILDEVFGAGCFQNHIVWHYSGWNRHGQKYFNRRHDQILYYSKGKNPAFNSFAVPWESKEEYVKARKQKVLLDKSNREYVLSDAGGGQRVKRFLDEALADGRPADDVWDIDKINNSSKEAVGYETQKPEVLLERVIQASSKESNLVADFFCGSGTTATVAEKLGRRWIACDLGRYAIHTARKRLLEIPDCKPFELLNLGKYERKYWQGAEFGGDGADEQAQAAYTTYIRFILDLYQAQPIQGEHVHGKKGSALVMVGAVDAPVTISHINDGLAECAAMNREELHVLGWEWEMGMNDPIVKQAKKDGVHLRLLSIPREVMEKRAVECGDIRFFDLAYLEAEVKPAGKKANEIQVELTDFVIPDTELIPEEVRTKITKWSDYIDYWAVDWDFQHDTFMNQWQTYRTRQNRKLELVSEKHKYDAPGTYRVLIKVVDIFGNDTSRMLEWEVK